MRTAGSTGSRGDAGQPEPPHDCSQCERLSQFIAAQRNEHPDWHNGPVRSFGRDDSRALIVGLAPGLWGANRTGRPFTGDYAGDLLYSTLLEFGLAKGRYAASPDDGLELIDCMVTNAVRCVPPQNKPTPAEIKTCRRYFQSRLQHLPRLRLIVALGRIAHDQILSTLNLRKADYPFAHGARHETPSGLLVFDSFHCSRYNTNTGKLTTAMFHAVFSAVRAELDKPQK